MLHNGLYIGVAAPIATGGVTGGLLVVLLFVLVVIALLVIIVKKRKSKRQFIIENWLRYIVLTLSKI